MPSAPRSLLIATLLTVLPVGAAVAIAGGPDEEPAPEAPAYASIPLASYDTGEVTITRGGFCDRLPEEAVSEALGAEPVQEVAYGNGERADIAPDGADVAHEYGCTYSSAAGAEARAWVFAPPVTPTRAEEIAATVRDSAGCRPAADGPAYGDPSVALVCPGRKRVFASYRGLFGDAWLTCSIALPAADEAASGPDADLLERAGRWCVAVAEAASL